MRTMAFRTPPRGAPIVEAKKRTAELEEENRRLREENELLRAENERLSEMYRELSDRLLAAEKAIVEISERIRRR